MRCIEKGALDFIIKPFNESVIKTLFLNIYRYNKSKQNHQKQQEKEQSIIITHFQDRLKTFNETSSISSLSKGYQWITNHILQEFTPQPTIIERLSITSLSNERKCYLKQFINDWNFTPLELNEIDLLYCVCSIFEQMFLQFPELNSLQMNHDIILEMTINICNSYHNSNPYHNFRHAVDVLQSTWYFLCAIGLIESPCSLTENNHSIKIPSFTTHNNQIKELLQPIDRLALLIASIGHDVGHPGVNNHFMVTTANPLAIFYNDKSVLENYHSMAFFSLLHKHLAHNINSHPEYKSFRKTIIHGILCTDMDHHQDHVQNIKLLIQRIQNQELDLSTEVKKEKEKLILISAIMKCADISNCARPFENAKKWAIMLVKEFSLQSELEKELCIPAIPINEHDSNNNVALAKFQLSFIKNIAFDLYLSMNQLFPEFNFCIQNIQDNMDKWSITTIQENIKKYKKKFFFSPFFLL
ncbi:uncharacterized protein BX663DRAFT_198481 [Cokeromyces recurvatus]|uniref:uncharacterized protein n=1 Tax=Cokeromyces recurvatus TaxID=90255 RepID=UPI002221174C|nr:uncharacterized protein BX663DRAFT_198481 [Cokeromyces recurvatus]KAI7906595.1 hypothetical protein BX663DRAFT_198481 [Cokeromyces recurvatus]